MNRVTISDLSGGVVDAVDEKKIPDNCLVEAVNYEYVNGADPTRRKEIGLPIGLHIPNLRSFTVWYPTNNIPSNIDKHIYIADDGNTISLYYRIDESGYTSTMLFDDIGSDVVYFVSVNRVLIADGLNRCRYVSINVDGDVLYGILGIPAPTNKIQVSLDDNDNRYVSANPTEGLPNYDIGMGRERGNIIGVCYTVETDTGNESNPSPVNYEQRLMYKYPTADTDVGFQYFWAKALYSGLKIPDVSETIADTLKYYNIYVTDIDYTSGTYSKSFSLVARVRIVNKESQSYSDTSNEKLKSIDYTNNPSPVAKSIIESNNVIYVGNIKDKINFPFEFTKYTAINLNNKNDRDYVNVDIAIRIDAAVVGLTDFSDLDVHRDRYRIFAQDRITPINLVYKNVNNAELRCYLRIPLLNRGVNTIYFCYYDGTTDKIEEPIIPQSDNIFFSLENTNSVNISIDASRLTNWMTKIPASPNQKTFAVADTNYSHDDTDTLYFSPIVTTDNGDLMADYPSIRFGSLAGSGEYGLFRFLKSNTLGTHTAIGFTVAALVKLGTASKLGNNAYRGQYIIDIEADFGGSVAPVIMLGHGMIAPTTYVMDYTKMQMYGYSAGSQSSGYKYFTLPSDIRAGWHLVIGIVNFTKKTMDMYIDGVALTQITGITGWTADSVTAELKASVGSNMGSSGTPVPDLGMEGLIAAAYGWKIPIDLYEVNKLCDYIKYKYGLVF